MTFKYEILVVLWYLIYIKIFLYISTYGAFTVTLDINTLKLCLKMNLKYVSNNFLEPESMSGNNVEKNFATIKLNVV